MPILHPPGGWPRPVLKIIGSVFLNGIPMGALTVGTTLFALLSGDLLAQGSLVLTLEMGAVLFAGSSAVIHLSARRQPVRA